MKIGIEIIEKWIDACDTLEDPSSDTASRLKEIFKDSIYCSDIIDMWNEIKSIHKIIKQLPEFQRERLIKFVLKWQEV